MEITFDFSVLAELGAKSPLEIMWIVFIKGGWIIFAIAALRLIWVLRLYRLQSKYADSIEYTLLAIDVPKNSEQTPKAMEQVFATLSGAHSTFSLKDKYKDGALQLSFSFEIISIDGYIQFLVRTPKFWTDLVESAVYAQYPDAEITEVYDYTADIPSQFPNDQYQLWGSEVQLVTSDAFPIRTYQTFEDILSQELKDPLASVLETMSRIKKGEQVWIQIIVEPTDSSWTKKSMAQAYKLAGKKSVSSTPKSWYTPILDFIYRLPEFLPFIPRYEEKDAKDQIDFKVLNLTPGERASIEAIEKKATKIGFICKIRLMYLAPHDIFSGKRVVSSVFGSLKQFGDNTSNAFKPNKRTKTQVVYFNPERRSNTRRAALMRNYKNRSRYGGSAKWFILNTEELATLYHFPSITIKTPLLKRTEVKKSDSPAELPVELLDETDREQTDLREQLEGLDLDNDYFEKRYGKGAPKTNPNKKEGSKNATDSTPSSEAPDNLPIAQ